MRNLKFSIQQQKNKTSSIVFYKIANSTYQLNYKISKLKPFIQSKAVIEQFIPLPCQDYKTQIYSETCLIGENKYSLQITSNDSDGYQIISGSHSYHIDKNNIYAEIPNIDIMLLTGPVLILNLALNNVFCLHASCFILNNKTFILMADSGTGKSTIARFIDQNSLGTRVADDIVPLDVNNGKIRVLADFPQLKLPANQQYFGEPIQNPIILLFAKKCSKGTEINEVNGFTALKKLIQHSVATKLFAPNELQNHLDFCFEVSHETQAFQVDYSHTENSLSDLVEALNAIV